MSASSKNIIIIGPAHPLRGGLASYNERLAREFQHEGHHVDLYTFSLQYPQFLFPGTTQFSSEPAPIDLSIHILINSINPFNWIKIGLKIKKSNTHLIIVRYWLPFMGPCLGTILRIASRNKKIKVIYMIQIKLNCKSYHIITLYYRDSSVSYSYVSICNI